MKRLARWLKIEKTYLRDMIIIGAVTAVVSLVFCAGFWMLVARFCAPLMR